MVVASRLRVGTPLIVLALMASAAAPGSGADASAKVKPSARAVEFFESKVRPLLAESCLKCHGPTKQSSGLRLDSREAMLKGGASGPAVIPGDAAGSLVVQAVSYEHDEIKMPPKGKLDDPAVSTLKLWVTEGAYWPDASGKPAESAADPAKTHWAFQAITRPSPPPSNAGGIANPVDAFIVSKLKAHGIEPSPAIDRRSLIRRATYDLLGLPPTADQIEVFEKDERPNAYALLIERLLASPAYGERWGRHWLDVARYADTKGYVFVEDRRYPFAYTYRDYVVNAFNRDLPFDQFIVQQLAADQLPLGDDPGPLAAMGYLTVGRRFLKDIREIIDDRIDVVTRGLLGLTVTCARCHDHKFDPIPTADYYSLYGVFASSDEPDDLPKLLPAGSPEVLAETEHAKKVQAVVAGRDAYLAERHQEALNDFQERFSRYFRLARDMNFDPRHPDLVKLASDQDLNTNRLRALAFSLQRGLNVITRAEGRESVLRAWRSFSGLKAGEYRTKAAEIAAELQAKGGHPIVARAFVAKPPTGMSDVVDRYVELFADVESRWKTAVQEKKSSLADAEWESFRQAVFGANGLATLPPESDRYLLKKDQKERLAELDKAIAAVKAAGPPPVPRGMVLRDAPKPVDPHIFVRGNSGRPGKVVPRQFLAVLSGPDRKPFPHGSGRLDLARAITDPRNPLTARVLANRVWAWHFGSGLVSTPSDFGTRSDPPSHPELLDWLADELIRGGWSLKSLHRLIMLSNTYQQESELRPDCQEKDPQNRLVWRFNRQRLDFEGMRDAVLAASGAIDRRLGGPSIPLGDEPFPTRRTLYGFIDRQNLDPVYRTFDFAVPDATTPRRFVTTVPQQALFLMNSPFLQEQARRLAAEVERDSGPADPADRVRRLYRRVLGRSPAPGELETAVRFFDRQSRPGPGSIAGGGTSSGDAGAAMLGPGEQLAQVLLLTNEFSFID